MDERPDLNFSNEDNSKSPVWEYYLSNFELPEKAKCRLCLGKNLHKYVSRSGRATSGLLSHLKSKEHENESKRFQQIVIKFYN